MTKPGFALLQLLMGLALSAFVSTTLFTTLFQLQTLEKRVRKKAQLDRIASVIRPVIFSDLMAAFFPIHVPNSQAEGKKSNVQQKEKKEPHLFFLSKNSKSDKKMFQECTFITTHNVQVITPKTVVKPYYVRVTYTLKKESNSDQYTLVRTQSNNIYAEKNKQKVYEQTYDIAYGITQCAITYYYVEKDEKKEKNDENKNIVLKKSNEWDSDKQDSKMPAMPLLAIFELTIVELPDKEEKNIVLHIPLCNQQYGDTLVVSAIQKQKNNAKKDAEKSAKSTTRQPANS